MHTSIFLPSTTVPWSRSRARSASPLFAKVTKPNPCMQTDKNVMQIINSVSRQEDVFYIKQKNCIVKNRVHPLVGRSPCFNILRQKWYFWYLNFFRKLKLGRYLLNYDIEAKIWMVYEYSSGRTLYEVTDPPIAHPQKYTQHANAYVYIYNINIMFY